MSNGCKRWFRLNCVSENIALLASLLPRSVLRLFAISQQQEFTNADEDNIVLICIFRVIHHPKTLISCDLYLHKESGPGKRSPCPECVGVPKCCLLWLSTSTLRLPMYCLHSSMEPVIFKTVMPLLSVWLSFLSFSRSPPSLHHVKAPLSLLSLSRKLSFCVCLFYSPPPFYSSSFHLFATFTSPYGFVLTVILCVFCCCHMNDVRREKMWEGWKRRFNWIGREEQGEIRIRA